MGFFVLLNSRLMTMVKDRFIPVPDPGQVWYSHYDGSFKQGGHVCVSTTFTNSFLCSCQKCAEPGSEIPWEELAFNHPVFLDHELPSYWVPAGGCDRPLAVCMLPLFHSPLRNIGMHFSLLTDPACKCETLPPWALQTLLFTGWLLLCISCSWSLILFLAYKSPGVFPVVIGEKQFYQLARVRRAFYLIIEKTFERYFNSEILLSWNCDKCAHLQTCVWFRKRKCQSQRKFEVENNLALNLTSFPRLVIKSLPVGDASFLKNLFLFLFL